MIKQSTAFAKQTFNFYIQRGEWHL
jgi:hypothetical protein